MRTRRWLRCAVVAMALAGQAPGSLAAQLGELPPGAVKRQLFEGVRGELARDLLVDSSVAARYVPAGLSLVTLASVATTDSAMARYLAAHPALGTAVPSMLTFVSVDRLRVDDGPARSVVTASWQVRVRPTPLPNQPASRSAWVEIAYWSPDTSFIRSQGEWPPLRQGQVRLARTNPRDWTFELESADVAIRGRCRLAGARTTAGYALPVFTTLWAWGPERSFYELYTYYGHRFESCVGGWAVEGSHPLAAALNRSPADLPPGMETVLADGWQARSARYRYQAAGGERP